MKVDDKKPVVDWTLAEYKDYCEKHLFCSDEEYQELAEYFEGARTRKK